MKWVLHHAHPWDHSPEEARQVQERLRAHVRVEPLPGEAVRRVGGVDASFREGRVRAAAVVLDYATMQTVEQATGEAPLTFPYIPGLLSFREAPGILAALAQLSALPDVLMMDGHGLAHPRRFGIACHLGVLLDAPTIGCAKSLLVGKVGELGVAPGSTAEIRADGEVLGIWRCAPAGTPGRCMSRSVTGWTCSLPSPSYWLVGAAPACRSRPG